MRDLVDIVREMEYNQANGDKYELYISCRSCRNVEY